jgi:hypothetical protein
MANNLTQVKLAIAVRPTLFALVGAALLLLAFRPLLGDWKKGAMAASLALVLFFSYGHVYNALKPTEVMGLLLGRHRFLVPLWGGLSLIGYGWISARLRRPAAITEALNVLALLAVALPVFQIIRFELGALQVSARPITYSSEIGELTVTADQIPPDIYFIVLDAYTRQDVLQETFHLDNGPFLNRLEEMGFYVARCSQSNYAQTELSLVTALNFNHMDTLRKQYPEDWERSTFIPRLIRNSAVRQVMEDFGYTIVAFETGYHWLHMTDADVYITPRPADVSGLDILDGLNSFEVMLLDTSAGLLLSDAPALLPKSLLPDTDYPHKRHRERILYNLDRLGRIPLSVQSPKFVYAHLIIPHAPFVFDPEGNRVTYPEPIETEDFIVGYRDQVRYINRRMMDILGEIITKSRTPPVIILQGDHGSGIASASDRMAILNAYHLPNGGNAALYETISPVNTFRVVLNRYFDGNFELLEDTSYFSKYDDRFHFDIIPNTCGGEANPPADPDGRAYPGQPP